MITLKQDNPDLPEILNRNVSKLPNGCWEWLEEKSKFGTPTIRIDQALLDTIKVFWWIKHGYKPMWKHMEQKCRTPCCMNPAHFKDRTPLKFRKKQLVTRIASAPWLNPAEDAELHRRNAKGETMAALGKEYGVSAMTIHKAIHRHRKQAGIISPHSEDRIAAIWDRLLMGENFQTVCKESGIKRSTLQKRLAAYTKKIQSL